MKKTSRQSVEKSNTSGLVDPLAKTVLDSLSAPIAILDQNGVILETNQAWRQFAEDNQARGPIDFIGVNYLKVCDASRGKDAKDAHKVAAGIRAVIAGEIEEFLYDYPCHSPTGKHWYYMRAIRMSGKGPIRVVVSHSEITALKLAEKALRKREKERDRLRHALELAMEVQQSLLPKKTPKIKRLDIAGKSVYCDETGGDYYDFLDLREPGHEKVGVVIGDVSGHGIASALLMASARSALRQRSFLPGSISEIISDINRELTHDVGESGRFVTLLYMVIDTSEGSLKWVRAGHDPAIYYDSQTNTFEELKGSGLALGLSEESQYEENVKTGLVEGDIIVMITDGVWEAHNAQGEMFGKKAVYDIIRKNATLGANEIMKAIFKAVQQFQDGKAFEDDATLVVIKVVEDL